MRPAGANTHSLVMELKARESRKHIYLLSLDTFQHLFTNRTKHIYGRGKLQIWSPSRYAATIKLSSTSKNSHVPSGTWLLDQDKDEYGGEDNPIGVGPYAG